MRLHVPMFLFCVLGSYAVMMGLGYLGYQASCRGEWRTLCLSVAQDNSGDSRR